MKTRLCSINLSVRDYSTKDTGSFSYHGEVVVIDYDLKQYDFRFYNTDSGTLAVSIDCSKDVIKVIEQSETVNLIMGLKVDEFHQCVYRFDENNRLELLTRAWDLVVEDNHIMFEYDLYDKNDVNHDRPLTKNTVRIDFEGESKVC